MTDIIEMAKQQLVDGGYSVKTTDDNDGPVLLFENDAVLGFVLCFPDAGIMLERWKEISQRIFTCEQFALRRAESKAWNAYLVLLTSTPGDYGENIMLGGIEEDLVGTRKIARAGVADAGDVCSALLPLLAIRNAPRLNALDMSAEIRLRTTELPRDLVEGFLSSASEGTLIQLLEEDK
ncbi:hypothetical protein [Ruegeria hyattellae]|uniref:hypothetical protein n=1 Tax=Ruegeria hyattellae TaxID=3233337 RepID=UPI00355B99DD